MGLRSASERLTSLLQLAEREYLGVTQETTTCQIKSYILFIILRYRNKFYILFLTLKYSHNGEEKIRPLGIEILDLHATEAHVLIGRLYNREIHLSTLMTRFL